MTKAYKVWHHIIFLHIQFIKKPKPSAFPANLSVTKLRPVWWLVLATWASQSEFWAPDTYRHTHSKFPLHLSPQPPTKQNANLAWWYMLLISASGSLRSARAICTEILAQKWTSCWKSCVLDWAVCLSLHKFSSVGGPIPIDSVHLEPQKVCLGTVASLSHTQVWRYQILKKFSSITPGSMSGAITNAFEHVLC